MRRGVYFLLNELGIGVPGWDVIWPVFPFAGGLAFLGGYIFGQRRDPGHVFIGTAATLVGLVFFFVTLGPLEYHDLGVWWPVTLQLFGPQTRALLPRLWPVLMILGGLMVLLRALLGKHS